MSLSLVSFDQFDTELVISLLEVYFLSGVDTIF